MGMMGPQGPPGLAGMPGMKMAIVPCQSDFVALFCVESPEVRFEDVVRVLVTVPVTRTAIDPWFIEVCEPGSIDVISVTSPFPALVGAAVEGFEIVVRVAGDLPPLCHGHAKRYPIRQPQHPVPAEDPRPDATQ